LQLINIIIIIIILWRDFHGRQKIIRQQSNNFSRSRTGISQLQ